MSAGKPCWSAQGLVWSFHSRSGDLLFRGARRRCDGRVQQGHDAQRLSVVIRAYHCRCTRGAVCRAGADKGRAAGVGAEVAIASAGSTWSMQISRLVGPATAKEFP